MYIRLLSLLLLTICFFIPNRGCLKEVKNQCVYVSSTTGNDTNNGLSPQCPVKTIKKAKSLGDTILLKAGDYFFEGELKITKTYLSRYGEGSNPTICGYKRIVNPNWVEVERNIWKLSLIDDNFSGIVIAGPSLSNNICAFHDYENDMIHGRKVWHKEEMINDWDFWQTEVLKNAEPEGYNDLYLYLSTNPNLLKLELSIYDCALTMFSSSIDGINIEGFGFGISAYSNTIVRNCKLDAIGGRIISESPSYNCYGNGIEFYVDQYNIENCVVEDCYISRCYDCGITIQGRSGTKQVARNIKIRNNLITNCCQGWEDFLRNKKPYENCSFSDNIIIHSGDKTGFGYKASRFKYCHVLGNNTTDNKGMIIENNVFADGNFYCSNPCNNEYRSNIWIGNKCYIECGSFLLGSYEGTRDVLRVADSRKKTSSAIKQYRELTGDNSTRFIVCSKKRVMAEADRLERSFLKKHKY